MPPSDFILRDGEDLVLDLHPHWWYFAQAAIAAVVAVALAVLVLGWAPDDWDWLRLVAAAFVLGTLLWLVERYIRWVSIHFILTSDRVIWREGVVAKHGIEIPLQRINTIFFSQRIFERMLGLGDLKIESASETGAQIFEDIRRPSRVQDEIYRQMEANENRGLNKLGDQISAAQNFAPAAPTPNPQNPPSGPSERTVGDQIAELHQLHQQGAITEAEFAAKKAELLGRM